MKKILLGASEIKWVIMKLKHGLSARILQQ